MGASRPKSLAEAKDAHQKAYKNHQGALEVLWAAIESKTYGAAATAWKECHAATLLLKEATNHIYAHLGELKPKKADKLKPGGKLDNAPEPKAAKGGQKTDRKEKRRDKPERAEKVDEASSDEPTDTGDKDDP
jgi:hypothetical protein